MFRRTIIAGAAALILVSGQGYGQEPEQDRESPTTVEQKPAADDPISVVIVTDPAETEASERREEESAETQKRDLVAQQRMAEATEAMNRATQYMMYAAWLSVFIGAGGLGALVWTFREQRKMFRADAQAYVEVVWLDVWIDPTYGLTLLIDVANRGKTPAKGLHFSGRLTVKQVERADYRVKSVREDEHEVFAALGILPANSSGKMEGQNYDVLEDFRFLTDFQDAGSHGRKTWSVVTEDPDSEIDIVRLNGTLSWDDSFNPVQKIDFGDIAVLSRDGRPLWLGNRRRAGKPK